MLIMLMNIAGADADDTGVEPNEKERWSYLSLSDTDADDADE